MASASSDAGQVDVRGVQNGRARGSRGTSVLPSGADIVSLFRQVLGANSGSQLASVPSRSCAQ
jgi:hypothetical protein